MRSFLMLPCTSSTGFDMRAWHCMSCVSKLKMSHCKCTTKVELCSYRLGLIQISVEIALNLSLAKSSIGLDIRYKSYTKHVTVFVTTAESCWWCAPHLEMSLVTKIKAVNKFNWLWSLLSFFIVVGCLILDFSIGSWKKAVSIRMDLTWMKFNFTKSRKS